MNNEEKERLIKNLILLGSMSNLFHRIKKRTLPKSIRRIIKILWKLRGHTFFYKNSVLPNEKIIRKFNYKKYSWLIECDLGSDLDRHIAIHGEWEKPIVDLCHKLIQKNDTAIDVGANIGFHTILLSSFVGEKGKVFCFEPIPLLSKTLKRNLWLNDCPNVITSNKAATDTSGEKVEFYCPTSSNLGLGSLKRNIDLTTSDIIEVETIKLDNLIDEIKTNLSLIKIDVQGEELKVLMGGKKLIVKYKPTIIFELEDEYLSNPDSDRQSVFNYFEEINYELWIIKEEFMYKFNPDSYFHGDLLAIPASEKLI